MKQSRGKGPFAFQQQRGTRRMNHWSAPRVVKLESCNIEALLRFISKYNDIGVNRLFSNLGKMDPGYRLARNVSELLRLLAKSDVQDVLIDGLSDIEHNSLCQLEQWGISLALLSVAHDLLNIRARQRVAVELGDMFYQARCKLKSKLV